MAKFYRDSQPNIFSVIRFGTNNARDLSGLTCKQPPETKEKEETKKEKERKNKSRLRMIKECNLTKEFVLNCAMNR